MSVTTIIAVGGGNRFELVVIVEVIDFARSLCEDESSETVGETAYVPFPHVPGGAINQAGSCTTWLARIITWAVL